MSKSKRLEKVRQSRLLGSSFIPIKELPKRTTKKDKKIEVCRICLSAKDDKRITIDADSEWTRLLEYCVGISVNTKSGPQVLCENCSKKLKDYSDFKTLVLKSDTLWNNVVITEIKEGPAVIDYIHNNLKNKDEESVNNYEDDAEYLDVDFIRDPDWIPDDDAIKEQEEEDRIKDEIEFEEHEAKGETEIKTKKSGKQNKDTRKIKDNLNGLTGTEFVRKFFDVTRLKNKVQYECVRCGEGLTHRKALPLHVQKCCESEVLIVKKQNDPEKAQKRQEVGKTLPSIFDCGLCDLKNADEDTVTKHVNDVHCLTNDLNCKLCDYTGRDMADVIVHRYKHMPQEFKYRYRCPLCGYDKVNLNELCLQFHYRSAHLDKAGGWCAVCNKTFTSYRYFRNHMRSHREEKYICDICGQKFLFRNQIEVHMKVHMNMRDYICDTCGKSFNTNSGLQEHLKSVHVYSPVFCEHCRKTFKNPIIFKIHMRSVLKQGRLKCEICSKKYSTSYELKMHMIVHSDKRPFMCDTCGAQFKYKCHLKKHKKIHLRVNLFKCDLCERSFNTSSSLRRHGSVHTGIRKVKCAACDHTFHDKKRMLVHFHKKHKSYVTCEIRKLKVKQ